MRRWYLAGSPSRLPIFQPAHHGRQPLTPVFEKCRWPPLRLVYLTIVMVFGDIDNWGGSETPLQLSKMNEDPASVTGINRIV